MPHTKPSRVTDSVLALPGKEQSQHHPGRAVRPERRIVVDDLATATAFFVVLGLRLQREGSWVDRVVGLVGVRAEIVQTPAGPGPNPNTRIGARARKSRRWPQVTEENFCARLRPQIEQASNGVSIEVQRRAVERVTQANGWEMTGQWLGDDVAR
jgi:hypothetical protein